VCVFVCVCFVCVCVCVCVRACVCVARPGALPSQQAVGSPSATQTPPMVGNPLDSPNDDGLMTIYSMRVPICYCERHIRPWRSSPADFAPITDTLPRVWVVTGYRFEKVNEHASN
jgi:hypothetical protein